MRITKDNEYEGANADGETITFKFNSNAGNWEARKFGSRAVLFSHTDLAVLRQAVYVSKLSKRELETA